MFVLWLIVIMKIEYLCFRKEIVCHPNRTENTSDQGPLPLGKTEGTENLIFLWNTLGMKQLCISLRIVFFQPLSISLLYHLIVAYKARFPLFHTKRIFYLNLKLDCSQTVIVRLHLIKYFWFLSSSMSHPCPCPSLHLWLVLKH